MTFCSPTSTLRGMNLPLILHRYNTVFCGVSLATDRQAMPVFSPLGHPHRCFSPWDGALGCHRAGHRAHAFPYSFLSQGAGSPQCKAMQEGHTRRLAPSVWVGGFFFQVAAEKEPLNWRLFCYHLHADRQAQTRWSLRRSQPCCLQSPASPDIPRWELMCSTFPGGHNSQTLPSASASRCFPGPQTMQPAEGTSGTG